MEYKQYRVPFDETFRIADFPTSPASNGLSDKELKKELQNANDELYELQRTLYAHNQYSMLLVFQAMDAAGKDSTIRHVMRGVNPAGCQVFSFKQPSREELDHDFMWRTSRRLPERGRIGIFNRSYYEETLVVQVHPEYLKSQRIPKMEALDELWKNRYRSIREHEEHLSRNGTKIIKFWLNVSPDEQKDRFLDRLNVPRKNWKFSTSDIAERKLWDHYMKAYENTLNATSREYAPWYAIPADHKPYTRLCVARIIIDTIKSLDCHYPEVSEKDRAEFEIIKGQLENE